MGFLDRLDIAPTDRRAPDYYGGVGNVIYRLGQALRYQPRDGREITVPAGYETDLASIPTKYQQRSPDQSPAARPGVVHDYLYTSHERSRREADRIFRQALREEGVPLGKRLAMWLAVRMNGRNAYDARSGWYPGDG